MDTKDLNGPAPEEQSGKRGIDTGNTENNTDMKKQSQNEDTGDQPAPGQPEPAAPEDANTGVPGKSEENDPPASAEQESAVTEESKTGVPGKSEGADPPAPGQPEAAAPEDAETAVPGKSEGADPPAPGQPESAAPEEAETGVPGKSEGADPPAPGQPVDFQTLGKEELLKVLEELLDSQSVHNIRTDVEAIKVSFYKRHKAEIELKRKRFMQEGGDAEAFEPGEDPAENRFKELYRKYRHSKAAHNRSMEHTRQENLEEKLKVIEDLKELVNRNEDISLTFQEFRQLQKRWHEIGMVPQQNLKDLWDTYHHYVETFYDHIKIDKELRDLDLKKNLEAKIQMCEKAEELLLEINIINAFRQLQKYHDQWRETGPVPRDQKDVIWERFREVTHQINKKHQEHFDKLKEAQKKNLDTKTALCEKAETINENQFENYQQVEKLTREMIGLQRTWKTIGFAPKKDNTKIYQRFRNACDGFFARKRDFNAQNKEYLNENLQKKLDLCVQAETLKESKDWKKTTDELIALQKRWKEIGPGPRKHYDSVWKRFRAACDHFFSRKSEFFSTIDTKYEENLQKKLALIEKIENFKSGGNLDENLRILKEYQREWVSIGFVPIREKDNIQKRYRAALDKHFEALKMDDNKKSLMKFRHKLDSVKEKPNAWNKLKFEREKFLNRFRQLESDITLWENNIGFFAKSRSAEATIREFKEKIEQGKKQMEMLEEKIRMIDDLDND